MTDEEICRHYRLAADKREAVTILADLNAAGTQDIRQALHRGGVKDVPGQRTRVALAPEKEEKVRKMLLAGETKSAAAQATGLGLRTVERIARRLPKNDMGG